MVKPTSTRSDAASRLFGGRGAAALAPTHRVLATVLAAVSVGLAAGCADLIEEARKPAPPPLPLAAPAGPVGLLPQASLTTAMAGGRADASGAVSAAAGMLPMRLVRPIAVAARGTELVVADAGLSRLIRFDVVNGFASVIGTAPVTPGTRIELGADRSLFVVDGATRRVTRLAADGRVLQRLDAAATDLARPVAVAVSPLDGRVLVADDAYRQLVVFNPAGVAYSLIPLRGGQAPSPVSIRAFAAGPGGLYLGDAACRCVLRATPDGRVVDAIGRGELDDPVAIAADALGRVFVADARARELSVYVDARRVQRIGYASLGVTEVVDMKVADGLLHLADAGGARVEVRRVVAARARAVTP